MQESTFKSFCIQYVQLFSGSINVCLVWYTQVIGNSCACIFMYVTSLDISSMCWKMLI